MSSTKSITVLVSTVLALGVAHLASLLPACDAGDLVDRRRADFVDTRDRRLTADVRAEVTREGAGHRLRVEVSPIGPRVEPPRGFEHRAGSNAITADELAGILRGGLLEVTTRRGGETRFGLLRPGTRGRLPARRVGPDGRVDFGASTTIPYPLGLVHETTLAGNGLHVSEWRVAGDLRLRILTELAGESARLVAIESVSPTPASSRLDRQRLRDGIDAATAARLVSVTGDSGSFRPGPIDLDEWETRDLEGRYLLFMRWLREDPLKARAWVDFLVARGEFELLELVVLGEPRTFHSLEIGAKLARRDAPQWVRLAVWSLEASDSHTLESAEARLLLDRPGFVLGWFQRHPGASRGKAAEVHVELARLGVPPESTVGALEPLEDETVFRLLSPGDSIVDFGEDRRAASGAVYLHQVARALNGYVSRGLQDSELDARLFALTRHVDESVRQTAYLAYTRLAPWRIPHAPFLKVASDDDESPRVREAALLAASYSRDPEVWAALHDLASWDSEPTWRAAVSRLGDVGDGFSIETLTPLLVESRKLDAAARALVEQELERIRARVATETPPELAGKLRTLLERAAWVDLRCHPLEYTLVPWTLRLAKELSKDPRGRSMLEKIASTYEPAKVEKTPYGRMKDRVRSYAKSALESEK